MLISNALGLKNRFTIVALIVLNLFALNGSAQWNLNIANPELICSATGTQQSLRAIPDGNSGLYVFWLDNCSGNFDVYGQHYNGNGIKQWENEGRVILDLSANVFGFTITKYEDHFYMGWINNANDSCLYQKMDLNGAAQWASPAVACYNDGSQISGIYGLRIVVNEKGVLCAVQYNIFGYVRIRINHITHDGAVTGPLNGIQVGPLSFGSFSMLTDRYDGAYIYWSTGNGLTAPLKCMRIDSTLQNKWPDEITPTADF